MRSPTPWTLPALPVRPSAARRGTSHAFPHQVKREEPRPDVVRTKTAADLLIHRGSPVVAAERYWELEGDSRGRTPPHAARSQPRCRYGRRVGSPCSDDVRPLQLPRKARACSDGLAGSTV